MKPIQTHRPGEGEGDQADTPKETMVDPVVVTEGGASKAKDKPSLEILRK